MCFPGTQQAVLKQLSRRDFLRATGAFVAGAMLSAPAIATAADDSEPPRSIDTLMAHKNPKNCFTNSSAIKT